LTTFICGNSHVGALKLGLDMLEPAMASGIKVFPFGSALIELAPFSARDGAAVRLTDPEYLAFLKRFTGLQAITGEHLWGFCMGTHTAHIYRDTFWAEAEPSEICRPEVRPVSTGMLNAIIDDEQRQVLEFFGQVKAAGIRFFAVSAPPPRQDHPSFRRGVRRETVAFVDRRARDIFAGKLAAEGIDFILPPDEAATSDGFLKEEYGAGFKPNGKFDPHHANAAYGAMMMRKIAAYVASRQAAASG